MKKTNSSNAVQIIRGQRSEIDFASDLYPDAYRHLRDAPDKLYVAGSPEALQEGLAVVGARKATRYGLGCADRFARQAARQGVVIISGGARGCDAAAHRAALAEGGATVCVLGGGLDCLYPPEHWQLFQSIVDCGGAIVSEYPWDVHPLPRYFRARNRLIASLAKATLIVEAGLPSGTFSTADEALAANRDVLVVPGAITSENSHGANRLIAQGAQPIIDDETFQDALCSLFGLLRQETYQAGAVRPAQANADLVRNPIVEALMAEPLYTEQLYEIARKHFGEAYRAEVVRVLGECEACNLVSRGSDGKWRSAVA